MITKPMIKRPKHEITGNYGKKVYTNNNETARIARPEWLEVIALWKNLFSS